MCLQTVCALNCTTSVILSQPLGSTEGSLSDSGISDSGSEQESERERRLSALRRLARQLEAVLSPDHQAILDMTRVSNIHIGLAIEMISHLTSSSYV